MTRSFKEPRLEQVLICILMISIFCSVVYLGKVFQRVIIIKHNGHESS